MKRLPVYLCVLLAGMLLQSCGSHTLVAEAPDAGESPQSVPQTLSTVNVPIVINVNQVSALINRQLQGTLYKDDNFEGDNLKMTVTKTGNIGMQALNNHLVFTLPLHIWVQGRAHWEPCSFCPTLDKIQDIAFDILVRTESAVSISNSWQLKTNTSASYTWGNNRPALTIGPVSIPLTGAIDLAMRPFMNDLDSMIDRQMAPYLDMKPYARTAWTSIQEPMLIDKTSNLWLNARPT